MEFEDLIYVTPVIVWSRGEKYNISYFGPTEIISVGGDSILSTVQYYSEESAKSVYIKLSTLADSRKEFINGRIETDEIRLYVAYLSISRVIL